MWFGTVVALYPGWSDGGGVFVIQQNEEAAAEQRRTERIARAAAAAAAGGPPEAGSRAGEADTGSALQASPLELASPANQVGASPMHEGKSN